MKKLAFLGGAVAAGLVAFAHAPLSQAADHLDANVLAGNPMADILDLYTWPTADASKMNIAMTVSPIDPGTQSFGPTVVYAFHIASRARDGLPGPAADTSQIICKFVSNTDGECWVTNAAGKTVEYVKGDLSSATGVASASGAFRVFAGRRSDPFFFNFLGFKRAVAAAEGLLALPPPPAPPPNPPTRDNAGCPKIDKGQGDQLRGLIQAPSPAIPPAPCPANQADCFLTFNVMAIVVQVDTSVIVTGTDIMSVWASTHVGS